MPRPNQLLLSALILLTTLAGFGEPSSGTLGAGMELKELWPSSWARQHRVSADGRFAVFIDDRTGDLCVRDLRTGSIRNLTNKGSFHINDAMAGRPAISPDGEWIAFRWYDGKKTTDLRIMRSDGTEIRQVVAQDLYPVAFSADGKRLVAVSYRESGLPEAYHLVTVADGSTRPLFAEWKDLHGLAFSARGDRIVYSRRTGPRETDRDLFLANADGSGEEPLLTDPGDDRYPLWTPDGKHIVFRSNRSGSMSLWSIPVEGGDPKLLRQDVGDVALLGFDKQGTLYYSAAIQEQDLFVADLDPATGQLESTPRLFIKTFVSQNRQLTLSPDGQWMAWYSTRDPESSIRERYSVIVRRVSDGEEYVMPLRQGGGTNQIPVRWFPDSKALLLPRGEKDDEMVVERVEVPGGARSVVYRGKMSLPTQWTMIALPGGRLRWAACKPEDRRSCEVILRRIDTGEETRHPADRGETARAPLLSPDRKWQAEIVRRPGGMGDDWDLYVRPAGGGQSVILARSGDGAWIRRSGGMTWSPDSKHLIYVVAGGSSTESNAAWEFRLVSREGGEPMRIPIDGRWPALLPDGRLVFGTQSSREELWAIRNLPGL